MTAPLHVVLYHPARMPITRYGGLERVIVWLARGLAALGHRVTLIAGPRSDVPEATVIPIDPKIGFQRGGPDLTPYLPPGVDIVHSHAPLRHMPRSTPYAWTLHGNATPEPELLDTAIAVSADHARRHGIARWVHNGLDPADYRFSPTKGDFDLFLGRLHSVKGWQWAVSGARDAGQRLVVAGGWRPSVRRDIQFIGQVGGERKVSLLADAACLWMPAQWDEPFGLTTIEAMVSGTPVLGTHRGALPEIVTPESGALGDSVDELVRLRPALGMLDPEAIRNRVLQRFTHLLMAEAYLALYRETIATYRGRG
ncbi:MAG TPA: glycosyltransferase [Gemmatimonadales bacterium]|jgi:glycosyltransferase involved in cell wall biosynthesis